jgi:hypothetical protein
MGSQPQQEGFAFTEKITVAHLVKKFPTFYVTLRVITACVTAHHSSTF